MNGWPGVDPLEPSGHPAAGGDRRGDRGGSSPASAHAAIAASALVTLKAPGRGTPAGASTPGPRTRNVVPSAPGRRRPRSSRRRGPGSRRSAPAACLARQPAAVLVVDADQGEPGALRREQRRLGAVVVLLVGVEVEVVAAEVEEDRDVEDDAVDPAHHQRVAAHLHGTGGDVALAHHREQRVQVGRLRGREGGLHLLPRDPGADGADHAGPDSGALQPALGQAGGGGLALGAGHADHPHRGGGVAVDARGEPAQQPARVRDDEQGHAVPVPSPAPPGR